MGIAIDRTELETLRKARRVLWDHIDRIERSFDPKRPEKYDSESHDYVERLACDLDELIDQMER